MYACAYVCMQACTCVCVWKRSEAISARSRCRSASGTRDAHITGCRGAPCERSGGETHRALTSVLDGEARAVEEHGGHSVASPGDVSAQKCGRFLRGNTAERESITWKFPRDVCVGGIVQIYKNQMQKGKDIIKEDI